MLRSLQIRNFAIVDEIEVEFSGGMTVLTGETGAGKSILVDALGLVLGDRASATIVREGAARAEFNAEFLLEQLPHVVSWLEEQSLNTYENAIYSKEILDDRGITRIVLVTSAWHMPRSVALFEKQGFEVIPAPADYTITDNAWERLWKPTFIDAIRGIIPTAGNLSSTTGAMKEYIGILIYQLRGWI